MPAVYKNNLDFEILDLDNSKILVFLDCSQYMDEHPENPILEVVVPGFNNSFTVSIIPKKVNVLNANTIGFTKTFTSNYENLLDLPDGVYCYTYRICPYDKVFINKKFLRTSQLQHKIKKVYKSLENTECSNIEERSFKNKLVDIDHFLATAKAYAEDGDSAKASSFYQIAEKFTDNILKKLNNFC